MGFVTKDKLQLHSFSHATDDFYAHSMLYMHHISHCMVLVFKQIAPIPVADCILCSMVLNGWFTIGYSDLGPQVDGVFLVGSTGYVGDMAGRSQSLHRIGKWSMTIQSFVY